MTTHYTTMSGDMVDEIAFRHYGRTDGTTEQILAANPGLSDRGAVLPAGVSIILPDVALEPLGKVKLWE